MRQCRPRVPSVYLSPHSLITVIDVAATAGSADVAVIKICEATPAAPLGERPFAGNHPALVYH